MEGLVWTILKPNGSIMQNW